MPKWPINQFKPVQQSRQQALRAYCPNIYSVKKYVVEKVTPSFVQNIEKQTRLPFHAIQGYFLLNNYEVYKLLAKLV